MPNIEIKDTRDTAETLEHFSRWNACLVIVDFSDGVKSGSFPHFPDGLDNDHTRNGTRYKSRPITDTELAAMGLRRIDSDEQDMVEVVCNLAVFSFGRRVRGDRSVGESGSFFEDVEIDEEKTPEKIVDLYNGLASATQDEIIRRVSEAEEKRLEP